MENKRLPTYLHLKGILLSVLHIMNSSVFVSDSVHVQRILLGCSWCNSSFCGTDAPVNSLQLPSNMGDICGCCEANNLINQFIAVHRMPPGFTHKQHAPTSKDSKRQMRKQLLNSVFKESSFLPTVHCNICIPGMVLEIYEPLAVMAKVNSN